MNKKLFDQSRTVRATPAPVRRASGWLRRMQRFAVSLLLFGVLPLSLHAQNLSVSGTVIDGDGAPLVGVSVVVKGSSTGVTTDAGGRYAISAPANATLVFSFLGLGTVEEAVAGRGRVDVTLRESDKAIDEVVVVGYGMQKKATLTGSIATLNTTAIQSVPASNLSSTLGGRLTGVYISGGMGGRPGNSAAIVVRSKGTWNSTDPLYVIDGVVRDKFAFDGIDANDVESISILKDAASTAIYGSRSANGVVLIATKKGREGKPVITYSGSYGLSDATRIPATQNAYDHAVFINDGLRNGGADASNPEWFTDDELAYYKDHTYSWIDESWQNPMLTQHSLNVSGGNQHVRYFVGGSHFYEQGGFSNMTFKKYTLRGNIEANITGNLTASLNLNLDTRDDHKPYWANDNDRDGMDDTWGTFLLLTPSFYPSYINGLPVRPATFAQTAHIAEVINRGGETYNNRNYTNQEASIALQYNIPAVEGLSVKALYNLYNRQQFTKKFNTPQVVSIFKTTGEHGHIVTDEPTGETWTRGADGNLLDERYDRNNSYHLNAFVNYDRTFGDHSISAVLIYEQSEGTTGWFKASTKNFINTAIDQFPAGSKNTADFGVDGNGGEDGRLSYAGRIHYGYADKYLVELSARYDGSVKFAPDRRWGFFPSASAAWRISEESFFKENVSFVDYLKLRASAGLLGNDAVDGWQWMSTYSFDGGAQYGSAASGLKSGVLANPEITWEKSLTYDGGLDFAFLNNRLNVALNAYYKHTYDILGNRVKVLPVTFGGKDLMPAENYGVVDSHGYEVELSYTDRIGNDFIWRAGGNISYATNKYVKLDEAENIRAFQSKNGLNLDRAWGYVYTDIIRTQADLDALPEGYTIMGETPQLGMLNYKDIRGVNSDEPDGKITAEDQDWIIENTLPPVSYGILLGAEWKGLALDVLLQGFAGHDVLYDHRWMSGGTNEKNYAFWTDHWTPENTGAKYPRAESSRYMWGDMPASSFWVKSGSFLRLKNISLSYALPKSMLSKIKIAQAKVLLTATNPFLLIDHIKDFDPELGINNGTGDSRNMTRYPPMKSISLGLNFSF